MSAAAPATGARIDVFGVPIDPITLPEAVAHVLGALDARRGGWVITPNLDQLRRMRAEPELRAIAASADLVVADGAPLVWASRIQGTPLPERVAGSDLMPALSDAAGRRGRSVFLLGGEDGSEHAAAAALTAATPGLRVAGTLSPPFGFERSEQETARIAEAVRAAAPDIVFVGLGFPKQERLIIRLREQLPGAWYLGIGASISFTAGRVARSPRWMRRTGLEWVHRLASEPRRLARRYLVDGLPFAARLFAHAAAERIRRRGRGVGGSAGG